MDELLTNPFEHSEHIEMTNTYFDNHIYFINIITV